VRFRDRFSRTQSTSRAASLEEPEDPIEQLAVDTAEALAGGSPTTSGTVEGDSSVTLDTRCSCGHQRRDHRGLRLEVRGPCLRCSCEEFGRGSAVPDADAAVLRRIQAGLEQIERLNEVVSKLRAGAKQKVLRRSEWLALQRDFCGEEIIDFAHGMPLESGPDLDSASIASTRPQMRVWPGKRATVISIQDRIWLFARGEEAMVVVSEEDSPPETLRLLWRGKLSSTEETPSGVGGVLTNGRRARPEIKRSERQPPGDEVS
jgi:hypothetical protein